MRIQLAQQRSHIQGASRLTLFVGSKALVSAKLQNSREEKPAVQATVGRV